jgi:cell wall-associated NlpC family hydrolase
MEAEEILKRIKIKEKNAKYRSIAVTFLSMLAVIVLITFTTIKLRNIDREIVQKQSVVDSLDITKANLTQNIVGLKNDEKKLTLFVINLLSSSSQNNNQYGAGINWEIVTDRIINLPSGKRKTAVMIALLMTWKEIPFQLGQNSMRSGFDSPSFLIYVLKEVGINVKNAQGELNSVNLMNSFEKVEKPQPGDLMFYKGQVGNFGFIYICEGDKSGKGIGIGTVQAAHPLALYETKYVREEYFPFIGYYKVNYEN